MMDSRFGRDRGGYDDERRAGDKWHKPTFRDRPFWQFQPPMTSFRFPTRQNYTPPADNLFALTDNIRKLLEIHFLKTGDGGKCNLSRLIDNIYYSDSIGDVLSATETKRLRAAVHALDHPHAYSEYVTFDEFLCRLRFDAQDRSSCATPARPQDTWAVAEKEAYQQTLKANREWKYLSTPLTFSQRRVEHRSPPRQPPSTPPPPSWQSTPTYPQNPPLTTHTRRPSKLRDDVDATLRVISAVTGYFSSLGNRFRSQFHTSDVARQPTEVDSSNVLDRIEARMAEKAQKLSEGDQRSDFESDGSSDMEIESVSEGEGEAHTQWVQTLLAARQRPLTADQEEQVSQALAPPHDESLVVEKYKIEMSRRKISCLLPSRFFLCSVLWHMLYTMSML